MTLEEIQEMFSHAITIDLEQGEAGLNEKAMENFVTNYPQLTKAIHTLQSLKTE